MCGAYTLEDGKTLEFYHIKEGSVLLGFVVVKRLVRGVVKSSAFRSKTLEFYHIKEGSVSLGSVAVKRKRH